MLFSLSEASGASGSESAAAELALSLLRGYCPDAEIKSGNVIGFFGERSDDKPLLVLDAHIDQIGFVVTDITDEGFIKFDKLGGIDRRLLPAQPVIIHGKNDIPGVICSVPPHLSDGSEVLKFEDAAIDAGMSREELTGVAAILLALDKLRGEKLRYNVAVNFSTQEELGERGAKIGAYTLDADIALAVDVSFAMAQGENEKKCGFLGKGPMIGVSPSLSRDVTNELMRAAESSSIPYQTEVMNGLTSTNADRYSVSRGGAETCTVSIPLRNMHTPVEVIDLDDVRLTADLIAAYIKEVQ